MKTFKKYYTEKAKVIGKIDLAPRIEKDKFFLKHGELGILNTFHGAQRISQRSELSKNQLNKLFKTALEKVKVINARIGEVILFFSKSLNQGFISAVDKLGLRIITFLPRGKQFPKHGTQKVVIESVEYLINQVVELN